MTTEVITAGSTGMRAPVRWVSRTMRSTLLARLEALHWGTIDLREPGQPDLLFGSGNPSEPLVVLTIRDPAAWSYVTLGADIGAGQAYAMGLWETSNLRDALRIFLRNDRVLQGIESGWSRLAMPLYRWIHHSRDNSRDGSRSNIAAHYDLGNEFFRTFLDARMLYSSGVYPARDSTLEEAQVEKMERICRQLDLQPGQRLLEIGSGWGGFAVYVAKRYQVQVRTITLSERQFHHTRDKVARHGLEDQVDVQLMDYRDVPESQLYDHVVSIEMIEAVGHRHMGTYLEKIDRLLRPGGRAMIQGITFPDRGFERYLAMSDFIRHFIFPGGSLVSVQQILNAAADNTRLELFHAEDIGEHYARTLHEWHKRYEAARASLTGRYRAREFQRLWTFYLQSCEACFMEQRTSAVQLGFRKARN